MYLNTEKKETVALRDQLLRWSLFLLPLLFLLLFYFYPLIKILQLSFFRDIGFTGDNLAKIFTPVYGEVIWFSLWQAALSTILTILLALPGAYIFAKFRFRGKDFLQALMTVPFVMPTVVTASAFKALLGDNGLVNSWLTFFPSINGPTIHIEQSITFFLLAHVFYNYALVVRIVSSYWRGIDEGVVAAARMLGASKWKAFYKITLPLLLPALGSSALLVFIFCFTSFGVILILGGPGYATLEVEIYRQTVHYFNLPVAAILSLIQIVINFTLMWIHARLSTKSRVSFFSDGTGLEETAPVSFGNKFCITINLCFMLLLLLTPLAALLIRSFTGEDGFTLSYYLALFSSSSESVFYVSPAGAVKNSIGFGLAAMSIALFLGLLASSFLTLKGTAKKSFWDAVIMLPLATSAVTLGFGYIITLNKPPLNLRDSLIIIPIAHALVAFPFVVRCLLPAMRQIPGNLREAAYLLGATPLITWISVDLPLIRRALLVAAVFGFSISLGEFGASSFLARPHTPTMPVAIFRFLSQPGAMNYGQAMAMSSILMAATCLSFYVAGKLDKGADIRPR
jgi:thiamine transport system permease protein